LRLLERAGVAQGYEFDFVSRFYKTMDFLAVYPREDSLVIDREAICEVFRSGGLKKYTHTSKSLGFVVEVKTGLNGCNSRPSKKQKNMFRIGRKLGFGIIIAEVALRENYIAEITFKDEDGNSVCFSKFET
jgi:hypothetical protein